MEDKKYEFVVVGSGAGGATIAKELSERGKEVLVVERGSEDQEIGSLWDTFGFYDMNC
ncbi:MAG: FAD-dependent oxidoreductase [Candidatus Acetothermia bacterium]